MARFLYTAAYYLLLPVILLRLYYRSLRQTAYRHRVAERLGFGLPKCAAISNASSSLWIHAVSVGETVAIAPLVHALRNAYPQLPIVMTTMTPTGAERVEAIFGDEVIHAYAPYDIPGAINRFLRTYKPLALVIMETELWPNIIHGCYQRQVPVTLVNARLSAKSARGYQKVASLALPMLAELTTVAAQTQADAERFQSVGLSESQLTVTGNIKFDIALNDALVNSAAELKTLWSHNGQRKIWIAVSTHEGEDEQVFAAHQAVLQQMKNALLIVVPRHPERFESVFQSSQQHDFATIKRSTGEVPDGQTQVVIGDTMGELLLLLGAADVAFIGGSLINRGGHNMLEAAIWGLPIITGESDFNFAEASRLLQDVGALKKVQNSQVLAKEVHRQLNDNGLRDRTGQAAKKVVEDNSGALQRQLALVKKILDNKTR